MSETTPNRQPEEGKLEKLDRVNIIPRILFHEERLIIAMCHTLKVTTDPDNIKIMLMTFAGQAEKLLSTIYMVDETSNDFQTTLGHCMDEIYNIYAAKVDTSEPPNDIRDVVIEPMAKLRALATITMRNCKTDGVFCDLIVTKMDEKSSSSKKKAKKQTPFDNLGDQPGNKSSIFD